MSGFMSSFVPGAVTNLTASAALETRVAALETQVGDSGIQFLAGAADPSAGAGVAATAPAFYARTSGGVSTWYMKEGAADTAWTRMVSQVFDALLTATRIKASAAGSAGAPAISLANDEGLYQEAANQIGFAVSGVRYARLQAALLSVLNAGISATGALSAGQQLTLSGVQATELTANTDNLALGSVATLGLTSTGAFNLTGITGGSLYRWLVIENRNAVGGDAITLVHDATSTAANRFSLSAGANLAIPAQGAVLLQYSAASRWIAMQP